MSEAMLQACTEKLCNKNLLVAKRISTSSLLAPSSDALVTSSDARS